MLKARFVHFATHGFFAQESPRKPGVADAETEFLDALSSRSQRSPLLRNGPSSPARTSTPHLTRHHPDKRWPAQRRGDRGLEFGQVELVVLSACETARGVDIVGEGSFSR